MKPSIHHKLENLSERLEEISGLLADPAVISNQNRFRELSQEYAQLEPVTRCFADYRRTLEDLSEAETLLADEDPDMREMGEEEMKAARTRRDALELALQKLLLPKDPNDSSNIFLEIRAGTGGDEAALFAGDLFRMYSRYAERQAGRPRSWPRAPASTAVTKRSSCASSARGPILDSSSSPAPIACSACRRPSPKAASTPPPAPWR